MESVKEFFSDYKVFERINFIEKWKNNYADPNIKDTINQIGTMTANLKNNIIPKIQENISEIAKMRNDIKNTIAPSLMLAVQYARESSKTLLNSLSSLDIISKTISDAITRSNDAIAFAEKLYNKRNEIASQLQLNMSKVVEINSSISNINPKLSNIVESAENVSALIQKSVPNLDKATAIMDVALSGANNALIVAKKLLTRLTNAVTILKNSNANFIIKANNLINVAKTEITQVRNAFIELGITFNNGATTIKNASSSIGQAVVSIYTNVKIPIDRSQYYINLVKNPPNLADRAFVFHNIFMSFNHLAFLDYGGKGGAFEEVMKGFSSVADEFKNLGLTLMNFGGAVYDKAGKISSVSITAMDNIHAAILDFVSSFGIGMHDWSLELLEPTDKSLLLDKEKKAQEAATIYAQQQSIIEAQAAGAFAEAFCLAFVGAFAQAYCVAFSIAFCVAFGKALGMSEAAAISACNAKKGEFDANCRANGAAEKAIAKAKAEGQCKPSYDDAYKKKYAEMYPLFYRKKYTEIILGSPY